VAGRIGSLGHEDNLYDEKRRDEKNSDADDSAIAANIGAPNANTDDAVPIDDVTAEKSPIAPNVRGFRDGICVLLPVFDAATHEGDSGDNSHHSYEAQRLADHARRLSYKLGIPLVRIARQQEQTGQRSVAKDGCNDAVLGAPARHYHHSLFVIPWCYDGAQQRRITTNGLEDHKEGDHDILDIGEEEEEYAIGVKVILIPILEDRKQWQPTQPVDFRRDLMKRRSGRFNSDELQMVLDWVAFLHGVAGNADDDAYADGTEIRSRKAHQRRTRQRPGKDLLVRAVLAGRQAKKTRKIEEPVTTASRVGDPAMLQPGFAMDNDSSGETDDDGLSDIVEVSAGIGSVIVDLTAGWGTDALALLRAGAGQVVLVERNPVVAALLRDAHRRLQNFEARARRNCLTGGRSEFDLHCLPSYASRIRIEEGDGIDVASRLLRESSMQSYRATARFRPDVVYLDPMFPVRTKSAAVKKPMQVLHSIMSHEPAPTTKQDSELLEAALRLAKFRVVVKRPIRAESLGMRMASFTLKGSTHRWDVYLVTHVP
jgi:16S rRNA (guanine1516-N2)-methyltransferase